MPKLLLNTFTLLLTLFLNYWLNTGVINGNTISDISEKYNSLFAPAGYAFAVWLLIYAGLIAFLAYQWYKWWGNDATPVERPGPWFALSNIFNAFWLYAWLNEYIGLSLILMFALLLTLVMLVHRLGLETWDAPREIIFFQWWPVAWYLGWIVVATVANVAAWLVSLGWQGGSIDPRAWTIFVIVVALYIYSMLIYKRNLRESAFIGIWGLAAIAVRHWGEFPSIAWTATIAAAILFAYAYWHGYINRRTLPLIGER